MNPPKSALLRRRHRLFIFLILFYYTPAENTIINDYVFLKIYGILL